MQQEEQEQLKRVAWMKYQKAETIEEQVSALELIVYACYEHSKAVFGREHPMLFEYSRHWVHSHDWDEKDLEVRDAMMAKYPKPPFLNLAHDRTDWKG